jgi:tripartite-type tricarboxylate transporter receptor subunit TctC
MWRGAALALFAVMLAATHAVAQAYPEQPVKIIVGFSPGVAPDITSRLLADRFSAAWGVPVVVENVTGAGGNIATDRVAKAAPDGYTLLMAGNSALIFSPSLYDKLPYDPIKDFAPISQVFIAANVLVVHPDVPAKTLPELIALARAQPGKLTYGHAGVGTSQHLAAELFKKIEHLDISPAGARRQAPRLRRDFAQAFHRGARSADDDRVRISRVRSRTMVRIGRAGRNAAEHRRQGLSRDRAISR